MKVGDLVRLKDGNAIWADGLDAGVGIITDVDKYEKSGLSYCVQWIIDCLWYESGDLELVSEK